MYRVKRIFGPTIQGEGPHAGAPCVFLRLAGCNAWDGRPETRADSACPYCDTDFLGGEPLSLEEVLRRLAALVPAEAAGFGCVLSGGEPLLQADEALLAALGASWDWVDVETNGTRPVPPRPANVAISCSPKRIPGEAIVVDPDWWKILVPAQEEFLEGALASGVPVYVQPVAPDRGPVGPDYEAACRRCVELAHRHGCRIGLQLHKYLGLE